MRPRFEKLASARYKDVMAEERAELERAGRLHWFHWGIVGLSLLLTVAAWKITSYQLEQRNELRFEREASRVIALVVERMDKYKDALAAGVAMSRTLDNEVSLTDWRTFAESLRIEDVYPGINGIGIIYAIKRGELGEFEQRFRKERPYFRVHPATGPENSELLPITFIEPEAPNRKAVGLDMAHEANRYAAAKKARRSGLPQITGPIVLVQDSGRTPGFLFYSPFYSEFIHDSEEDRVEQFQGLVYAPLIVKNLIAGTLAQSERIVTIHIEDNGEVLYDEGAGSRIDFDPEPMFSRVVNLPMFGRSWSFTVSSSLAFRDEASSSQPLAVLIGGLCIDALLLSLFLMLTRASRRALAFADRMTAELRTKAEELEMSNKDLESFAYVASHDLKTPLRGIADLKEYVKEDLAPYLSSPEANPNVARNLGRMSQQTMRMENLIKGILDYSSAKTRKTESAMLSITELLEELRSELGVRYDQLQLVGEVTDLETDPIQFGQVLTNLVSNAFKFHEDREQAQVTVSGRRAGPMYEFTIEDNGQGIEDKFQDRIFDVFESLHSKDTIEGSGVGLAIVKRIVKGLGGDIKVKSSPGEGAAFTFSWPVTLPEQR